MNNFLFAVTNAETFGSIEGTETAVAIVMLLYIVLSWKSPASAVKSKIQFQLGSGPLARRSHRSAYIQARFKSSSPSASSSRSLGITRTPGPSAQGRLVTYLGSHRLAVFRSRAPR